MEYFSDKKIDYNTEALRLIVIERFKCLNYKTVFKDQLSTLGFKRTIPSSMWCWVTKITLSIVHTAPTFHTYWNHTVSVSPPQQTPTSLTQQNKKLPLVDELQSLSVSWNGWWFKNRCSLPFIRNGWNLAWYLRMTYEKLKLKGWTSRYTRHIHTSRSH